MTQPDALVLLGCVIIVVLTLVAVYFSSKGEEVRPKKEELTARVLEPCEKTLKSYSIFSHKLSILNETKNKSSSHLSRMIEITLFKNTDHYLSIAQIQFTQDFLHALLHEHNTIWTKIGKIPLDSLHEVYYDALSKELKATDLTFKVSPNLDSITYEYTSFLVSEEIQFALKEYIEADKAVNKHIEDFQKVIG